ncbi:MAG: succinate dehydrogenase/fumarate reductase iron-sulfur subunit [Bacteroidales bacterium]|jgi:succinate dehydrogenase / fumarate reductase iron-sulfur subunit
MQFTLKIWRQAGPRAKGYFERFTLDHVDSDTSFLEMLDMLNNQLVKESRETIAFDHDCREGICGACGLYINGRAHGPDEGITTCQLYMRRFKDGSEITVEPFRSGAFPVIKDLVVNRNAFDKILQAGGFVSVNTGSAPEAHTMLVSREKAEESMDASSCIGCGACVASCKNGSAMLFVASRVSALSLLPQGNPEACRRARAMVLKMDEQGFGSCTNIGTCQMECPKKITVAHIARLNREFLYCKRSDLQE